MTSETKSASQSKPKNYLKCRDDIRPVALVHTKNSTFDTPELELAEGSTCSWLKIGTTVGPEKLRPRIEPWLTALCQSEHLSLLIGSGLTHAIHRLATGKALPGMESADFGEFESLIVPEAKRSALAVGRSKPNIEDQIRITNELLRGLEILSLGDKAARTRAIALRTKLDQVISEFAASILTGERGVVTAKPDQREQAFNYLVSFLMSFASRTGTRDRLHIFTTNYDRLIEAGAEVAGMHLLDRFVGSLAPIFRSSRLDLDLHYNPPGIRGEPRYLEGVARITKLHGSLDWVDRECNIHRLAVPFGAISLDPFLEAVGPQDDASRQLMIYPNAAKDRETSEYPYVELFRDLAAAACRPNHTLVAFGYSFGDEHINRVIEDMLTIPSTHLVVISYDDPLGRILRTFEKLGRPAQVSLLIGDHVGGFQLLVDHYLPKPAIDRTTFRMSELLKARWGAAQREGQSKVEVVPPVEADDL
jgi:hypothetical protein